MSKFRNKKTMYRGVMYDSILESEYAILLDFRLQAGEIKRWERQLPIPLSVNGILICKYIMDFVVYHNDGSVECVETKGFETAVYKLKAKLFRALNPQMKYTIEKRKNNLKNFKNNLPKNIKIRSIW